MSPRPRVLFYCQHSLGLGHLARSLALVDELVRTCDVVLLNGGRFPDGTVIPEGCRVVNLPPLGHDGGYALVSHDPAFTVETACAARAATVVEVLGEFAPDLLVIELYPFGRKKFEFELGPLLAANAAYGESRARVLCSLRDILVNQRRDQVRHDDRAATKANEYLDAIVVHSDPAFARLEESFRPSQPLRVPVHYSGFVAPPAVVDSCDTPDRRDRVIVSAGGGSVGGPLFDAAIDAAPIIEAATGLRTLLVAGPFLPAEEWERVERAAATLPSLEAVRQVPDLCAVIRASRVSVSQCGYNTTMDLLRARTPAVVVPYSEGKEDEQRRRAERLVRMGVLSMVPPDGLTAHTLAAAVVAAAAARPGTAPLDLDGRAKTAKLVHDLIASRHSDRPAAELGACS